MRVHIQVTSQFITKNVVWNCGRIFQKTPMQPQFIFQKPILLKPLRTF